MLSTAVTLFVFILCYWVLGTLTYMVYVALMDTMLSHLRFRAGFVELVPGKVVPLFPLVWAIGLAYFIKRLFTVYPKLLSDLVVTKLLKKG